MTALLQQGELVVLEKLGQGFSSNQGFSQSPRDFDSVIEVSHEDAGVSEIDFADFLVFLLFAILAQL